MPRHRAAHCVRWQSWHVSQATQLRLLTSVYGWCTEGFETADLREAKALLAELEG